MDKALDSGSSYWGFESLRAYQKSAIPIGVADFCIYIIKAGNPWKKSGK